MKYNNSMVLVTAVTLVLAFAADHGTLAALSDNYSASSQSQNTDEYLSNCLLDESSDGDIQRFEPMGCSENESTHTLNTQSTISESENVPIILINPLADKDIYVDSLTYSFEDPDEVGWD